MRTITLAALATTALTTAALAGSPTAAAGLNDWSGLYGGGFASFDGGSTTSGFGGRRDISGSMYGGFAGYSTQFGSIVLGAELGLSVGDTHANNDATFGMDYLIDAKARAGYAFGDALVYGVAGHSFSHWDNNSGTIFTLDGLSYGVGLDYHFNDTFFAGIEYLVRDLDGTPAGFGVEFYVESVQLRVGYTF